MKRFLRPLGKKPTEDAVATADPTQLAVWEKQETRTPTPHDAKDAEFNTAAISPTGGEGGEGGDGGDGEDGGEDAVGRDHRSRGEADEHEQNEPSEQVAQAESEKHPASRVDERQESTPSNSPVRGIDDEQRDTAEDPPPTAGNDYNVVYPGGTQLALLTLGLCLATFVVALDNTPVVGAFILFLTNGMQTTSMGWGAGQQWTRAVSANSIFFALVRIIATAIPRITTAFDSLDDVGWYGSSYLLTTTSLQPSFGKVYSHFNIKWTYLSALVIFELGSILCATAKNSVMLICGRAVAGAGAAALFSGGMTIIGYSVSLRKRAIFIASLSSMFGIASVVGPILGGVLTDKVSWRWCFWINLPFGGAALASVFFFFQNPARHRTDLTTRDKLGQIDFLGALFLISAIVCLLLALQWGGSVYPWHDSRVWGCLIGFGLILSVFMYVQKRRGESATIPPRILAHNRTVAACAAFSAFLAMALYTHVYYLPFYFQAVKGVSAEESGIRCIPYLVSITISSIIVGGGITIFGYYNPFMWVGICTFAVGSGMIYTLKVSSSEGVWIGYEILAGFGAGACVQIPFIAVQVVLSEKDMAIGNAIAIFFNTLGGAISVSIAQNIFENTLIKQLRKDAPTVSPELIVMAGATHIREVTTPQQLPGVLRAYDTAVTTAFILPIATASVAFFCSLAMEWKSVKGRSLIPGGA